MVEQCPTRDLANPHRNDDTARIPPQTDAALERALTRASSAAGLPREGSRAGALLLLLRYDGRYVSRTPELLFYKRESLYKNLEWYIAWLCSAAGH